METHPTSAAKKPPRERKLVGQHVYVQGAPQCTRHALDVVLRVVEEMFPGNVVDTPFKGALWARPAGKRSTQKIARLKRVFQHRPPIIGGLHLSSRLGRISLLLLD